MKIEAGKTTSLWQKKEKAERSAFPEKETPWEKQVQKSKENPNTIEYSRAVDEAKKLQKQGYTAKQLEEMGEKNIKALVNPEITDTATVVGALYQLEALKKPD